MSPGVGGEPNMSSGMPSESPSPGPVLAGLSFNDTVKGAASLTARVALYPSLLYNLARSQLQDNWHWFDKVTEVSRRTVEASFTLSGNQLLRMVTARTACFPLDLAEQHSRV